ncbi:MAG: S-adenosylmethionine decarboxylase [Methanothrix sp.]|nr:S-adenosylmethionine decarboxylase [Methanothrix sp.]
MPLIESGVQIHTLTKKKFITIDVYSCKRFEEEKIADFASRFFSPLEIDVHFIERGRKYHSD